MYNEVTKQFSYEELKIDDNATGKVDSTVDTTNYITIFEYTIPAGIRVKLGQPSPVEAPNSHILLIPMDDTA